MHPAADFQGIHEVEHGEQPRRTAGPSRPHVLLAEDHALVREGLRCLLSTEFEVIDAVADGRALLDVARQREFDVILVDIAMPGLNGIEAVSRLGQLCPKARVIFVTAHRERAYVDRAFRAGAAGYVVKSAAFAELRVAIHEALAGGRYLSLALVEECGALLEVNAATPELHPEPLTPRQREVLQLIAEGNTAAEIGTLLHISTKTVEYHKDRIVLALKLHGAAELTRYALARGIVAL